jgi:hypothetical protein
VKINWDGYKEYKVHYKGSDNFNILLNFIKSYYNMNSPIDIYELLINDDLAVMMLEKHNIKDAEDLENYLFRLK